MSDAETGDIQVGDEFDLRVKVVGRAGRNFLVYVVGCTEEVRTLLTESELRAGKRVLRSLRVGDRVTHPYMTSGDVGEVLMIDGDDAWLKIAGMRWTEKVSNLQRVPS